ncbi:TNT domain-containing protein [Rhodospirillum sp. A1_3_36]|uniref:TNT domain-containing protein n=1 Tax=Rhodospirillum sp. A1_3_36 TaxID=3391666 RepID=UPI0039A61936
MDVIGHGGWLETDANGQVIFLADGTPSYAYSPSDTIIAQGDADRVYIELDSAAEFTQRVLDDIDTFMEEYGDYFSIGMKVAIAGALTVTMGPMGAAGQMAVDAVLDEVVGGLIGEGIEFGLAKLAEAIEQLDPTLTRDQSLALATVVGVGGVLLASNVSSAKKVLRSGKDFVVNLKRRDKVLEFVEPNPGTLPGALDAEAGGASYYDKFRKADGSGWDWPDNLGFAGKPNEATIHVGTRLDRYGSPVGSFMSPAGTPLEQRAMAPGSAAETLHTYVVKKPLPVIKGEVAPAFDQPGGGTQMLPNLSERVNVDWLVRNGYLEEIV